MVSTKKSKKSSVSKCDNIFKNTKNSKELIDNLKGFSCVKKLGSGSFGTTYLFKKGNERIAIKHIILQSKDHEKDIADEVYMLKKIQKDCEKNYVLCFKNIFSSDSGAVKEYFVITEFIKGIDLWGYLEKFITGSRKGSIKDIKNILTLINQTIKGIKYLHNRGIIHYDIKPENIMVDDRNNIKIIDLGGGKKIINSHKTEIFTTYTPRYLPEEAKVYSDKYIPTRVAKYCDYYALALTIDSGSSNYVSCMEAIIHILRSMSKKYNENNLITKITTIETYIRMVNIHNYESTFDAIENLTSEF